MILVTQASRILTARLDSLRYIPLTTDWCLVRPLLTVALYMRPLQVVATCKILITFNLTKNFDYHSIS
jgi:hypothetical protein